MKTTVIALSVALATGVLGGCMSVHKTTEVQPSASPAMTTSVSAAPGATVVRTKPWCAGTFADNGGTNFGDCYKTTTK